MNFIKTQSFLTGRKVVQLISQQKPFEIDGVTSFVPLALVRSIFAGFFLYPTNRRIV